MFGFFLELIFRSIKLDKKLYREVKTFSEVSIYFAAIIMILDGVAGAIATNNFYKTSLSLSLSGADQTFISTVLNENVVNDTVEIYRGLLNSSNSIIADPILLYSGNIDTFEIAETDTQSNVKLIIVSHWADFDKKSGRKTNNASQQRFFSSDVGMDYASESVLDIKWGRE